MGSFLYCSNAIAKFKRKELQPKLKQRRIRVKPSQRVKKSNIDNAILDLANTITISLFGCTNTFFSPSVQYYSTFVLNVQDTVNRNVWSKAANYRICKIVVLYYNIIILRSVTDMGKMLLESILSPLSVQCWSREKVITALQIYQY